MKKYFAIAFVIMMTFVLMAGCGGGSGSGDQGETATVDSLKTIGDIAGLELEEYQFAVYEENAIYAFKLGDTYYRALAPIDEETAQAYYDVDIMEEGYEDKQNAIVAPLEIEKIENLSEQILTQEQCDALVGKTGQELLDDGWTCGGHNLESMEFWMEYGPFEYTVIFDGQVAEEDYEDFIDEEGIKDMTVKSVEFLYMGDATNLE